MNAGKVLRSAVQVDTVDADALSPDGVRPEFCAHFLIAEDEKSCVDHRRSLWVNHNQECSKSSACFCLQHSWLYQMRTALMPDRQQSTRSTNAHYPTADVANHDPNCVPTIMNALFRSRRESASILAIEFYTSLKRCPRIISNRTKRARNGPFRIERTALLSRISVRPPYTEVRGSNALAANDLPAKQCYRLYEIDLRILASLTSNQGAIREYHETNMPNLSNSCRIFRTRTATRTLDCTPICRHI